MHVCMMLIMIGALSVYKLEKNIFTEKKNHFRLHFIDHQWSMVIFHSFRFLYVCFQFWPMAMDYNHHHQFFPCLFSFVSFSFDSYKNRKQKIFLISDCHFQIFLVFQIIMMMIITLEIQVLLFFSIQKQSNS